MSTSSFEYESKILVETFGENFLLIGSKGLCVERLFHKHLQLYSDSSVLALVINAKRSDYEYFSKILVDNGHDKPKYLTSETGTVQRKALYLEGGVQFVTTPILISDILCKRIPISLVTGLLVYRAHTVLRSALESFILLTFRKEKPDIFVKAFSDAPHRFVEHLGQLQRAVSSLRVDRVYFLPRYHAEVISELDSAETGTKPDLVEIAVKLTPCMKNAQNYLIELLRACLQELKRSQQGANATDSDNDLNLEAVLLPWFEDNYRRKIESKNASFDQVPVKLKRLLNDISRLKQFLSSLEIDDGKSFAKNVDILRNDPREHECNSGWLFTPTAEKFIDVCKKRSNEVPTKWDALKHVIDEVNASKRSRLLILASDSIVCERIKQLISYDSSDVTGSWLPKNSTVELEFDANVVVSNDLVVYILRIFQRYEILFCLNYFKPDCVIFYNTDIWCIRQVEIYNASLPSMTVSTETESTTNNLRIYLLMYESSAEEQRYLTSLQQEKSSFEKLFKEETTLLIRKQENIRQTNPAVSSSMLSENFYMNDSHDADPDGVAQQTIVVDMREFRSELPALLHMRNVQLVPATLIVGDYILTSQICVERKAPQDLVGSLQSGRLFDQCRAMSRFYEKPLLLVELQSGRKGWRRFDDRQSAAKLAILAVTFPKMRIVWAPSPSAAAEIFVNFKFKREEPNLEKALNYGKDDSCEQLDRGIENKFVSYNAPTTSRTICATTADRLLTALPAISTKNVQKVFQHTNICVNFRQFCRLNGDELAKIFQSTSVSISIVSFLNKDFRVDVNGIKIGSKVQRKRK